MMIYKTKMYRINDLYMSLISEGLHAGRPAVIIRFAGCNRECPWCDTDWRNAFPAVDEMGLLEWVYRLRPHGSVPIVLTGGEPLLQCKPLIEALALDGNMIYVETNGTVPIEKDLRRKIDWLSVSISSNMSEDRQVEDLALGELGKIDEVRCHLGAGETPLLAPNASVRSDFWYIVPKANRLPPSGEASSREVAKASWAHSLRFVAENPPWVLSPGLDRITKLALRETLDNGCGLFPGTEWSPDESNI